MFCPKCQNEYKEGITICPECNTELVESLSDIKAPDKNVVAVSVTDEKLSDKIVKYLEHIGIDSYAEVTEETVEESDDVFNGETEGELSESESLEGEALKSEIPANESSESEDIPSENASDSHVKHVINIYVPEHSLKEAKKEIAVILKVETENKLKENPEEALKEAEEAKEEMMELVNNKAPKSARERFDDYMSSGEMLIILGIAAIIFTVLNMMGVISLFTGSATLWLWLVIGILVTVAGFLSIVNAKKIKSDIKTEEKTDEDINLFLKTNITAEVLDKLNEDRLSEEVLYLKKMDFIKDRVMEAFPDANVNHAEELIEKFYDEM